MSGGVADEAQVSEQTRKLADRLDGYERILSKQKYLAGDVSMSFSTFPGRPTFDLVLTENNFRGHCSHTV